MSSYQDPVVKYNLSTSVPVTGDFDAFQPPLFGGKVVAMTKDEITIKPEGKIMSPSFTRQPDGTTKETCRYVQDETKPPRTFVFTEELLYHSGLNPNYRGGGGAYSGHLVNDVKVGDTVYISCTRMRAKDYCPRITITARPDEKVPPTVREKQEMEKKEKEKR
jgi:hypothetical protein